MGERVDVVIDGVSRRFGGRAALVDASFTIRSGEVVGLLGPNGAGKTTLMRTICGYLQPDAGRVLIGGVDVRADPVRARGRIGYVPENAPVPADSTPGEFLAYCARLRGIGRRQRAAAIVGALRLASVEGDAGRPIGSLSRGARQRVAIAQALLGDPPVLILDEPTTGLDPREVAHTRSMITRLGRRRAVLLSSHLLPEVAQLCRRVVVLDHGRVVVTGDVADLRATSGVRLEVQVAGPVEPAAVVLGGLPGVTVIRWLPQGVLIGATDADVGAQVAATLVGAGIDLVEMRRVASSLEETYLRLVGG